MKKFKNLIMILILGIISVSLTGCLKSDSLEDITIYTTVYPIEYITDRLYSDYSTINSIYPDGVDVSTYKLTNKQIKDYASSDLLIFNGLNEEINYVTKFFEKNKNIKIIDATSSMEIDNGVEELWLNPSNLLMIAQNIQNGFDEYLTNNYIKSTVHDNFEDLKIEVSKLDASLSTVYENATTKNIIIYDDSLSFLSKYGFNIISIDPDTTTDKLVAQAKDLIQSGSSTTIFSLKDKELSEEYQNILNEKGISATYLHGLSNITEEERLNKENYITIMNDNIELIKTEVYK